MAALVGAGSAPALATAGGAATGAVANYLLQFHLTFGARAAHRSAIPRYLVASIFSWFANLLCFSLLHGCGLGASVAQGLTSLLIACVNFPIYQRVVFHERTAAARALSSHSL